MPVTTITNDLAVLGRIYGGTNPFAADAFGRARVSDTGQRLDVEFLYDKQGWYFDEITSNGTVTFNANSRDLTLSLSNATNGSEARMQSHPVPYTPGNSQLIELTGVLDLAEIGGGVAQCFVRSSVSGSVVETVYDQSSWLPPLRTGVEWTLAHIFVIDFQSLKVGRIRFGLNQGGDTILLKEVMNDNIRNAGYWQYATLPVYYRLYNDATYTYMELGYGDTANAVGFRYRIAANASATMKAICCTVKSEGGQALFDLSGQPFTASNGVTEKTVSTTLIPLLSIRMKSTFNTLTNQTIALPTSFSVLTTNPIRLAVIIDGTLTGASFVDVNATESAMEYDVTASAITGGIEVASDYYSGEGANKFTSGTGILGKSVLWDRLGSRSGILTLAAIKTGTSDADVLTSMRWQELR